MNSVQVSTPQKKIAFKYKKTKYKNYKHLL